jgi:hypothetical protein
LDDFWSLLIRVEPVAWGRVHASVLDPRSALRAWDRTVCRRVKRPDGLRLGLGPRF